MDFFPYESPQNRLGRMEVVPSAYFSLFRVRAYVSKQFRLFIFIELLA